MNKKSRKLTKTIKALAKLNGSEVNILRSSNVIFIGQPGSNNSLKEPPFNLQEFANKNNLILDRIMAKKLKDFIDNNDLSLYILRPRERKK